MIRFFLILMLSFNSYSEVRVDVNRGVAKPIEIGIAINNSDLKRVANVISDDLNSTLLFKSNDNYKFESVLKDDFPKFNMVSRLDLFATLEIESVKNKIILEFRLWDVKEKKNIIATKLSGDIANYRRISHRISDIIYEKITGERGYLNTRIVYVAERGSPGSRTKQLAIMDLDGYNHQFLTNDDSLSLTPRFSAKLHNIIYMSYKGKTASVYIRELQSGRERLLGSFKGMSFSPRFSPDDKKIILSATDNGNSEIYEYNLSSKRKKRLTYNSSIDVSPSYSPDQKKIVFNSDRGGSQQLYIMDASGKNVKRLSFGKGRYGSPNWSPRGDYIAFTKMYKGEFFIGVIKPDGTGERLLTRSFLDEGPSWAPNGRRIIFTRQTRSDRNGNFSSNLYSVDITGRNLKKIKTPFNASDPAWSPKI